MVSLPAPQPNEKRNPPRQIDQPSLSLTCARKHRHTHTHTQSKSEIPHMRSIILLKCLGYIYNETSQLMQDKLDIKRTLEEEARKCQWLVLWLDCDREGENIAFEVIEVCTAVNHHITIWRARFSALIDRYYSLGNLFFCFPPMPFMFLVSDFLLFTLKLQRNTSISAESCST